MKQLPRALLIALLISLSVTLAAREAEGTSLEPPVRPFLAPTIRLGFGTGLQSMSFDLGGTGLSAEELEATPNNPLHFLVGLEYQRIGAIFRFNIPGTAGDSRQFGETHFFNLQLDIVADRVAGDLIFQNHQGMYIANESEFNEEIESVTLPDLSLRTVGMNFFFATDPDYSLAAAYRLNARQSRTISSWILTAAASQISFHSPGGPATRIPAAAGTRFQEELSFVSYTGGLGGGAAATITIGNWFFAPLVAIGVGAQRVDYREGSETGREWYPVPQVTTRLSLGYNGNHFFAAILASNDRRNVRTPSIEMIQGSSRIELVLGGRL